MTTWMIYVLFACFLAGAGVIVTLYVRLLFGKRDAMAICSVALGEVSVKSRVKRVIRYKKPVLWVIVACLLLCAVVAVLFLTDPKKEDTPSDVLSDVTEEESVLDASSGSYADESTVSEEASADESEPEESQPDESSAPEPQDEEPKEPVMTDEEVVTLKQFHHTVLYLPFHSNDALPDDFIAAMSGNPIESDFLNAYYETGMSGNEFLTVWEKYEPYYRSEITSAIDALCADMGEEHREALVGLSDATCERYAKMSSMHVEAFHKSIDGGPIGTMYLLVEGDAKMDAYRQALYQIKYLHYLYEMHADGVASDALTFAYAPTYARKTQTLLIVSKTNRYVIDGSYTWGTDTEQFFEAMKNNPIDASDPMHIAYWEQQIASAKELLATYYDEDGMQEIDAYGKLYLDAPTEWLQVLSLMDEAGCIELTQEMRDACTADSYRQALFALKYLAFLWEYKDGMGEPDESLRFGKYVDLAPAYPEESATTVEKVFSFDIGVNGLHQYSFTFYDNPTTAIIETPYHIVMGTDGKFYESSDKVNSYGVLCVSDGTRWDKYLQQIPNQSMYEAWIIGNTLYVTTYDSNKNLHTLDISDGLENAKLQSSVSLGRLGDQDQFVYLYDGELYLYRPDTNSFYRPDGTEASSEIPFVYTKNVNQYAVQVNTNGDGWSVDSRMATVCGGTDDYIWILEKDNDTEVDAYTCYDRDGNVLSRFVHKSVHSGRKLPCELHFEQNGGKGTVREYSPYDEYIGDAHFENVLRSIVFFAPDGSPYVALYFLDRCDIYRVDAGYTSAELVP